MKARGFYSWHIVRILLGGVFVYAGLLKGLDPEAFVGQVAAYNILPYQWNFIVAAILPFVELIVGLHLVFNRWVRASAIVVAGLCGTFLILLTTLLIRGMEIDCGCFGPHDSSTPLQAIVRNLMLLTMAHFVFHLRNHYASPSRSELAD
jgi:putative oxidoreductase